MLLYGGRLSCSHVALIYTCFIHRISGVLASVISSSVVDREFESRSGQIKDYEIGICCLSAKYAALGRKSKYCVVQNQDNVSELGVMYIRGLLFH